MAQTDLKFDVKATDSASRAFLKLAAAVEELKKKLDELDGKRVKVTVTVNVDDRKLDQMRAKLAALRNRKVAIKVDVDDSQLNAMRAKLAALRDRKVEINVGVDDSALNAMRAKLAALRDRVVKVTVKVDDGQLDQLRGKLAALRDRTVKVTVRSDGDTPKTKDSKVTIEADADTAGASAALKALDKQADALDGKKVKIDVDVDEEGLGRAPRLLARVGSAFSALGKVAAGTAGVMIGAVRGVVGALVGGGGMSNAAGFAGDALGQLPSAYAAVATAGFKLVSAIGGVATGFLKFGTIGAGVVALGAAIGGAYGTATTAVAALPGALSLIAIPAATAMVGLDGIKKAAEVLQPAVESLQKTVSATFEKGLTPAFQKLATEVMPAVQEGMVGVAEAMSNMTSKVVDFVASSEGVALVDKTFAGVKKTIEQTTPAAVQLTKTVMTLASQPEMFDAITEGVTRFSNAFSGSVDKLLKQGTLQKAFTGLGDVIGSAGEALVSFVENGIEMFSTAAPGLAKGIDGLTKFFDRIDWESIGTSVGNIAEGIGDIFANMPQSTIDRFEHVFQSLGETFKDPAFQQGVQDWIDMIPDVIAVADAVISQAGKFGTTFKGVWDGIKDGFTGVKDTISGAWEGIKEVVFPEWAQDAVKKIKLTLEVVTEIIAEEWEKFDPWPEWAEDLWKTITTTLEAIKEIIQEEWEKLDLWPDWAEDAWKKITALLEIAKQVVQDQWEKIDLWPEWAEDAVKKFKAILQVAKEVIQDQWEKIDLWPAWAEDAVRKIKAILQVANEVIQDQWQKIDLWPDWAEDAYKKIKAILEVAKEVIDNAWPGGSIEWPDWAQDLGKKIKWILEIEKEIIEAIWPTLSMQWPAWATDLEKVITWILRIVKKVVVEGDDPPPPDAPESPSVPWGINLLPKWLVEMFPPLPGLPAPPTDILKWLITLIPDYILGEGEVPDPKPPEPKDVPATYNLVPKWGQTPSLPDPPSPPPVVQDIPVTYNGQGQWGSVPAPPTLPSPPRIVQDIPLSYNVQPQSPPTPPAPQFSDVMASQTVNVDQVAKVTPPPTPPAPHIRDVYTTQTVHVRQVTVVTASTGAIAGAAIGVRTGISGQGATPGSGQTPFTARPRGGGVVGFAGGGPVPLKFPAGGVLPGYAPGNDTIPAILSRGEAVLVPELVRQLGAGNIMAANFAASRRRPASLPLPMAAGGTAGRASLPMPRSAWSGSPDVVKAVGRLERGLAALTEQMSERRSPVAITVNDQSGNPTETARATQLALKMASI